jgi:hypothetical protein
MQLTGHASVIMHASYTHHEFQALKDAMGKMPSLNSPKSIK